MRPSPIRKAISPVIILLLLLALLIQPLPLFSADGSDFTAPSSASPQIAFTPFYEAKPNNTRSQANLVHSSYFGQPFYSLHGTISSASSDVDYFRFDTVISGEIVVLGYWDGPLADQRLENDLTVRLENASGTVLQTSFLLDGFGDYTQTLSAVLPAGTYYLRIASSSSSSTYNGAAYKILTGYYPDCAVATQPKPMGPDTGHILTSYSFSAHDHISDCGAPVQTQIDWGDGTYSSWSTTHTQNNSWSGPGMYAVRARERCPNHTFIVGAWSQPLYVFITAPLFHLTTQSADPGMGSVSPEGTYPYPIGTSVSVTASPLSDYRFYRWEEAGATVSRSNPFTFNLMTDRTLTAHFRDPIDSQRLFGASRYQTAVAISQDGWAKGAAAVVLARGDDYADALAGVPLAYAMNAPILLTNSQYLSASTRTEIQRLGAQNAVILGGAGAISAAVVDELESMGLTVDRIRGDNRYHTAALIAHALRALDSDFDSVVLAVGTNFPDALSAASYAAMTAQPILLTTRDVLPNSTAAALDALGIQTGIIAGGTGVISSEVEALLDETLVTLRIAGSNRYATSIALAEHFLGGVYEYCLATGMDFPDATTGAVLAAKRGTGILLVPGTAAAPPAIVQDFLVDEQVQSVTLFGGNAVISSAMNDLF